MASRPRSAAAADTRTRTAPVIGMCLSLGLLASTPLAYAAVPPAGAAAPVPVTVLNGDFAQPAFTGVNTSANPHAWSVGSTAGTGTTAGVWRWDATTGGHPGGLTAAMLRLPGEAAYGLKQRLRGVRSGARVTVTYDESPSVSNYCTAAALEQGQTYTVQGEGGTLADRTTLPTTEKLPSNYWKPAWRTGVTLTFTAGANEPLLTFTSTVPAAQNNSGYCGPLITNVRATHEPPPVDKTIPAGALPASEAFMGNDRRSTTADAVAYCNGAANRCTFTTEEAYSFSYYAPARVAAETYLNCTRNTLNRLRPVSTANRSYGDLPAAAGLPASGTAAPTNMAQQYTRGTGLSPAWNTTQDRQVTEVVQPAEASWIETQGARRRTDGWFTATTQAADPNNDWRLHTVIDHPSTDLSDRIYQRTGPLTASEKQRCQSDRPNAPTPVGATSPAGAER
ncbi:hypothetical protein [Streptomyces sp. NRRL S-241]|uniref:hypothetical protein n=1 Tax=Streptomyces sp. NRRL S-241 TaxID=1463896 RepID=UPI000690A48E|nr:hypothetical protein [Streptomyces sp. NRRL S-241]